MMPGYFKPLLPLIAAIILTASPVEAQRHASQPPPEDPVQHVYLFAEEAHLQRLFSRNPRSDQRVPGFVRLAPGGRVQGLDGGFRFRGNTSRYHPKKSWNIRFSDPQTFLFGSHHMNMNALYTDPSGMRERLGWDMFHELNRPASKTRYTALFINEVYEGLGLHIQRVDDLLLRQHNLDRRGTLVRDMTRRNAEELGVDRRSVFGFDLSRRSDQEAFLQQAFESRGNADWRELASLIQWVHDTPAGDDFYRGFVSRFDVEVFIDWLAIHMLIGDVDAFGDDYWLYRGRSSGSKWMVLPWDHDLSFGKNERDGLTPDVDLGRHGRGLRQLSDFFAYEYELDDADWGNALITRFLATDALRERLFNRLDVLMNEVFTPAWFVERTERLSGVIYPYMNWSDRPAFRLQERQHHGEQGRFAEHRENLLDFVKLRYAFIHNRLHEVSPSAYSASRQIKGEGWISFTDGSGWTIAWLDVSAYDEGVMVRITSSDASVENGIQQLWTIHVEGGSVEGELSLFYRNDIAPDGKANWYTAPVAVGRQRELKVVQQDVPLPTRVNPYSNKAVTRISLQEEVVELSLQLE